MQYLNEIVSGALSADMMDYLLRDGYFTGAEHAKIDHHRLTHSLDVYKNKLALDSSALVNFETMMISRFQMFKAVYFHKTVRAGEVMLVGGNEPCRKRTWAIVSKDGRICETHRRSDSWKN